VTDDDGGEGTAATEVTVKNVAPEIMQLAVNQSGIDENEVITVTGIFTDVGTLDTHTVSIDWGDGAVTAATVDQASGMFTASHLYLDDDGSGTPSDVYIITAMVTDDDQGVGTMRMPITVNNVAPVLEDLKATTIEENGVTTLTGTITDPGTLDSFSLVVDWGDPLSPKNVETYTYDAGKKSFELTHQYLDDNPSGTAWDQYTISLRVTDDDTGANSSSTTVTVENVAPVLGNLIATTIQENGTTTLTGTITDPGTLDTFVLVVNWGESRIPARWIPLYWW